MTLTIDGATRIQTVEVLADSLSRVRHADSVYFRRWHAGRLWLELSLSMESSCSASSTAYSRSRSPCNRPRPDSRDQPGGRAVTESERIGLTLALDSGLPYVGFAVRPIPTCSSICRRRSPGRLMWSR